MRRSELLDTTSRGLFHITLLVSVWLTFRGHNAPGGGFIGGLVGAGAFVMVYLANGTAAVRRLLRVSPATLLGSGLAIAVLVGIAPIVVGDQFLESSLTPITLPVIGDTKLASSVLFDIGVYLMVVGVVLLVIDELGAELGAGRTEPS